MASPENNVSGFDTTLSKDLFGLVTGGLIGSGIARQVYEYALDQKFVIKFEDGGGSFQNIREWENWREWSTFPNIAKWLAPCRYISGCGTILVQDRTTPVTKFPPTLPEFLTDRKRANYGMLNGRVVCHDYASMITWASDKVRKANWW